MKRRRLWSGAALGLASVALVLGAGGCYKLQEGIGDRGFVPERGTEILAAPVQPDRRQPDLTTEDSTADRMTADRLAREQANSTSPQANTSQRSP